MTVWATLKIITFKVKTATATFGQRLIYFGLLFIPISGHTEHGSSSPSRASWLCAQVYCVEKNLKFLESVLFWAFSQVKATSQLFLVSLPKCRYQRCQSSRILYLGKIFCPVTLQKNCNLSFRRFGTYTKRIGSWWRSVWPDWAIFKRSWCDNIS